LPEEHLLQLTGCTIRTHSTLRHGLLAFPRTAPHQPLGPVLAVSKDVTTITLPSEIAREPLRFTTHTVLHLNRTVETMLAIPRGEYVVADAVMLASTKPIEGFVRFDKDFTRLLATLVVPQATLVSEDTRAEVCGVIGMASTLPGPRNIPLGTYTMALKSLAVTRKDEPGIFLTNIQMGSATEVSNGLLHTMQTVTVDAIDVAGAIYGPVVLHTAVRNLDADALARLQTLAKNAQRNSARGANSAAAIGVLMASLPEVLTQFLQASPCIEFQNWSAGTPHGTFTLRGMLAASTDAPINAFAFLNIGSLLKLINADLTVALPQAFVDNVVLPHAGQMPLDVTTLLVKSATHYTSHIVFNDGVLTVNGTPMPLPGLD